MKYDINRWIFEIPSTDIISVNYPEQESSNCCFCCGKKIKGESYYVHLLTNGNIVSTDQEFSPEDDQGFFPIGNECKNKVPNNFIFKTT